MREGGEVGEREVERKRGRWIGTEGGEVGGREMREKGGRCSESDRLMDCSINRC